MHRLASMLILAGLILIGCNSSPATEAPLDPHTLLTQAAANLRAKQTFRLIVERTGADYVFKTDLGDVIFKRAEGQYVSPDVISAKVKVLLGNLPIEADVYAKGADQSVRGMWTNMQWQASVFAPGFDPSQIMPENAGFDTAMNALVNPQLIGEESMEDGTPALHITATADGKNVSALVVNLLQMNGQVKVDVYLSKADNLPLRFVIVQPDTATAQESDPTTWTIDLYDFDSKAEFDQPSPAIESTAEATAQS